MTKYTSLARENVYSRSSSSSQIVTLNLMEGVYVLISGKTLASVNGETTSNVGVVCNESSGAVKSRDFISTLMVGGGVLYWFSYGMIKSAGRTESGSEPPKTEDSRSMASLPQILACLPVFLTSSSEVISVCISHGHSLS